MTHYDTPHEFNATGLSGFFQYASHTVPFFNPMLLFTIFMITMIATYSSQVRQRGRGDLVVSFAVAALFTDIIAGLMVVINGYINLTTISITFVVAAIAGLMLILSKDRD